MIKIKDGFIYENYISLHLDRSYGKLRNAGSLLKYKFSVTQFTSNDKD